MMYQLYTDVQYFLLYLLNAFVGSADQPGRRIARGRLRSVQLEVMDEISRDSLAGSNFTKGREGILRQQSFFKLFFLSSRCSLIFGEKENLKSLSSLGDFPREDNFRKFSL